MRCVYCHEDIAEGHVVYEEQIGWAARRAQGGLHGLRVRKATGRIACERCITKLARGVDPGQESIDIADQTWTPASIERWID